MVFNILCNNNDDHLRNHGFLWDGKGWRLSPGYDIVPSPQVCLSGALRSVSGGTPSSDMPEADIGMNFQIL
jgi:hypothetical protein